MAELFTWQPGLIDLVTGDKYSDSTIINFIVLLSYITILTSLTSSYLETIY